MQKNGNSSNNVRKHDSLKMGNYIFRGVKKGKNWQMCKITATK